MENKQVTVWEEDTLSGEVTLSRLLLRPTEKWYTLKRICPPPPPTSIPTTTPDPASSGFVQ